MSLSLLFFRFVSALRLTDKRAEYVREGGRRRRRGGWLKGSADRVQKRSMIANLPSSDAMKQKRDDAEENHEGSLEEEKTITTREAKPKKK